MSENQDTLLRCRDVVQRILMTRAGEVISGDLAIERANNIAQALLIFLLEADELNALLAEYEHAYRTNNRPSPRAQARAKELVEAALARSLGKVSA